MGIEKVSLLNKKSLKVVRLGIYIMRKQQCDRGVLIALLSSLFQHVIDCLTHQNIVFVRML